MGLRSGRCIENAHASPQRNPYSSFAKAIGQQKPLKAERTWSLCQRERRAKPEREQFWGKRYVFLNLTAWAYLRLPLKFVHHV